MPQSVSILIPARDDAERIGALIAALRKTGPEWELLVIDDGSRDETARAAEAAGARVLRHPYALGAGAAIKTALPHATGDVVVVLDADAERNPAEILQLLAHMDTYDLVIGARAPAPHRRWFEALGHAAFLRVARWISESDIRDLTSRFRAMRRDRALEFLRHYSKEYSYPAAMTLSFIMAGYFVHYVPLPAPTLQSHAAREVGPLSAAMRFTRMMAKTVMLFDPLKVFLPAGALLLVLGNILLVAQYLYTGGIQNASAILLMTGVVVIFFGLIASQNANLPH